MPFSTELRLPQDDSHIRDYRVNKVRYRRQGLYLKHFLKHQISEHHEKAGAQYDGVIEDINLEWLDPIDDAAPVGITEMQSIPEGSSDLAKEYGVSHAAEVQEWWLKLRLSLIHI